MKQRDHTFPKLITKTKSKHYVALCPKCDPDYLVAITGVLQFRIQASQALKYHLQNKHNLTLEDIKKEYES